MVAWRNNVVGYVDDRSAILGLGTAEQRFRTDKGLGPGSTEGAVLSAHGMSPTRLKMASTFDFHDPVEVLIYNDQGIAYAITVEDKQSSTARPRPPLGIVRWIIIFPPGSAGKILPLP